MRGDQDVNFLDDQQARAFAMYGDDPVQPLGPVARALIKKARGEEGVKFDQNKRRIDLVPTEAINALADVLTAGAVKYGEHNWRHGMDWSRVYGAAQRHMLAFWGGDDIDEESGMPHLWHALTNMAFLVSYQALSVGRDDRWKQEDE